jgi:hypothetical protein
MGLGSANAVSLADARKLRKQMATGREACRAEKASKGDDRTSDGQTVLSFDKAIDLTFDATKAKWTSSRHPDQ